MFLNRETQLLSLTLLLFETLLWSSGGILLTAAVMRPRRRERLMTGLAVGLLLFVTMSNALSHFMQATVAFWTAASLIFVLGTGSAYFRRQALPWPGKADLPYAALFLVTFYVAFVVNRGLSIQDDYHNLPLVSTMAAGDIPPHFYLNAAFRLAYHYGLHVLAAALVNLGGLTPWSAFDLSKALTLALALPLAAIWIRRSTSHPRGVAFGTAVFAFIGGARWILLLAPGRWLDSVSSHLTMLGSAAATGGNLRDALVRPWMIEGGGPLPFPFAFSNGIRPPTTFTLAGSSLLPEVTLLVLLLLHRRDWRPLSAAMFAVLLSSLALSGELLFLVAVGALGCGLALNKTLGPTRGWSRPPIWPVLLILAIASGIALIQGGVLTEIMRAWVGDLRGSSPSSYYFRGLAIVWPPRIVSAHLGALAIHDPSQLVLAILEIGPALFLLPMAMSWSWKHLRLGSVFAGGLVPLSLALAAVGLILQYESLRETSRFPATALTVWLILGLPPLVYYLRNGRSWPRAVLAGCLLAGMFGGVVLFSTQVVAAAKPTRAYFVSAEDAAMADRFWNVLPRQAQVFDRIAYRGVTLFGRPTFSYRTLWMPSGEFGRLAANPSPSELAGAGYSYLYMDETWWSSLSPAQRSSLMGSCVVITHEEVGRQGVFRRLYDLRGCYSTSPE
jgi:hypothetical protein